MRWVTRSARRRRLGVQRLYYRNSSTANSQRPIWDEEARKAKRKVATEDVKRARSPPGKRFRRGGRGPGGGRVIKREEETGNCLLCSPPAGDKKPIDGGTVQKRRFRDKRTGDVGGVRLVAQSKKVAGGAVERGRWV